VAVPEEDLLEGVDCSELSRLRSLHLRRLGGNMMLPSQLHELSISRCCIRFAKHDHTAPLSLTDCQFKHSSRDVLSEGLVYLDCFRCYNLALPSVLPSTLQHLEITSNYNVLLIILRLGDRFNCPLSTLPPSLPLLQVEMLFNQDLRPLPPRTKELNLGKL
jgi:hypothetical protein